MPIKFVEDTDDLNRKRSEAGNKLVVINFFANWFGPCTMIGPKLEECAEEHPDVVFQKVEVNENADLVKEYNIIMISTMIFVKKKQVIETFSKSHYEKVLSQRIEINL